MKSIKVLYFLFFVLVFSTNSCKDDNYVPVFVKVVEQGNQNPVDSAIVIYNADKTFRTDSIGEFETTFNLCDYLADSISLFISKEGFHSKNYSTIVGNTQKDIFLIQLERK